MSERIAVLVLLLIASWCVMTFTHEAGHILAGWIGGGTLVRYDVAPWRIPYSVFIPDPMPLWTLWGGPLVGVVVPLLVAAVIRRPSARFIADFCLLSNGTYLAVGWFSGEKLVDTSRLLDAGARPMWIVLYCVLAIGFGYVRFRRDCIDLLRRGSERSAANPNNHQDE